jgi:hypothetical protein
MDFKNSDIANGLEVTNLIGADASASLEGAALLKMAIQSGNIMPLSADGQLVLPAGVGLDDITVVGRDLIIQMPDGTQMIVPDGAKCSDDGQGPRKCTLAVHRRICRMMMTRRQYMHTAPIIFAKTGLLVLARMSCLRDAFSSDNVGS